MYSLLAWARQVLNPVELLLEFPGTCISATGESEIPSLAAVVLGKQQNSRFLNLKNADNCFGGTARVLLLLSKQNIPYLFY